MTLIMILIDITFWVCIIAFIIGMYFLLRYKEPFSVLLIAVGAGMALCITLIAEHDFNQLPPTVNFIASLINS